MIFQKKSIQNVVFRFSSTKIDSLSCFSMLLVKAVCKVILLVYTWRSYWKRSYRKFCISIDMVYTLYYIHSVCIQQITVSKILWIHGNAGQFLFKITSNNTHWWHENNIDDENMHQNINTHFWWFFSFFHLYCIVKKIAICLWYSICLFMLSNVFLWCPEVYKKSDSITILLFQLYKYDDKCWLTFEMSNICEIYQESIVSFKISPVDIKRIKRTSLI